VYITKTRRSTKITKNDLYKASFVFFVEFRAFVKKTNACAVSS